MIEEAKRMRPVIILPKKAISQADMKRLRDNGICVVEAEDPSLVRFCEPPPEDYSAQERAAISLCRYIMRTDISDAHRNRADFMALYAHFVIDGTPLQYKFVKPVPKAKK